MADNDPPPPVAQPESEPARHTVRGLPPMQGMRGAATPQPADPTTGQANDHWVLSPEERAKGQIRPVRTTYRHLTCDTTTRMPQACAETYARDPGYYSGTFCVACRGYFPVGAAGEFVWLDDGTKVGT